MTQCLTRTLTAKLKGMVDFNDIVKVGSILLSAREGVWLTETHQNNTSSSSSSNRDCTQPQDELQVRNKDKGLRICLLNKSFPANSHRILKKNQFPGLTLPDLKPYYKFP